MSTATTNEQVKSSDGEPVPNGSETPPTEYPGPPQQNPTTPTQ